MSEISVRMRSEELNNLGNVQNAHIADLSAPMKAFGRLGSAFGNLGDGIGRLAGAMNNLSEREKQKNDDSVATDMYNKYVNNMNEASYSDTGLLSGQPGTPYQYLPSEMSQLQFHTKDQIFEQFNPTAEQLEIFQRRIFSYDQGLLNSSRSLQIKGIEATARVNADQAMRTTADTFSIRQTKQSLDEYYGSVLNNYIVKNGDLPRAVDGSYSEDGERIFANSMHDASLGLLTSTMKNNLQIGAYDIDTLKKMEASLEEMSTNTLVDSVYPSADDPTRQTLTANMGTLSETENANLLTMVKTGIVQKERDLKIAKAEEKRIATENARDEMAKISIDPNIQKSEKGEKFIALGNSLMQTNPQLGSQCIATGQKYDAEILQKAVAMNEQNITAEQQARGNMLKEMFQSGIFLERLSNTEEYAPLFENGNKFTLQAMQNVAMTEYQKGRISQDDFDSLMKIREVKLDERGELFRQKALDLMPVKEINTIRYDDSLNKYTFTAKQGKENTTLSSKTGVKATGEGFFDEAVTYSQYLQAMNVCIKKMQNTPGATIDSVTAEFKNLIKPLKDNGNRQTLQTRLFEAEELYNQTQTQNIYNKLGAITQ